MSVKVQVDLGSEGGEPRGGLGSPTTPVDVAKLSWKVFPWAYDHDVPGPKRTRKQERSRLEDRLRIANPW